MPQHLLETLRIHLFLNGYCTSSYRTQSILECRGIAIHSCPSMKLHFEYNFLSFRKHKGIGKAKWDRKPICNSKPLFLKAFSQIFPVVPPGHEAVTATSSEENCFGLCHWISHPCEPHFPWFKDHLITAAFGRWYSSWSTERATIWRRGPGYWLITL